MSNNMEYDNLDKGSIKIADDVVGIIAGLAAIEVEE